MGESPAVICAIAAPAALSRVSAIPSSGSGAWGMFWALMIGPF